MTDSVHPTLDELGDYSADVLDGVARTDIRIHLDGCPSCRAELAALDDVAAVLADAGREPEPIPADVAARLDDEIARISQERDAGLTSLAEHARHRALAPARPRRGRWVLIGGAAAAAVFVIGGVISGGGIDLGGTTGRDDDAGAARSAADAGGDAALESDPDDGKTGDQERAGGNGPRDATDKLFAYTKGVPTLAPDNTGTYALRLADKKASKVERIDRKTLPRTCRPVADMPVAAAAARRTLVAEVSWIDSRRALLFVNPKTRVADVYGCGKDPQPLYTTPY